MAGRDMTLEVIVKLRDLLSSGLDGALRKITNFGARAKASFDRIGTAIGALSAKFGALGLGAGLGLADGLRSATEFDAKLRDVAITYGLVGKSVEDYVAKSNKATQALAKDVGQLSSKLIDVRGLLAAANVDSASSDVMLRPIGRVATAAGAEATDITKTAIAGFQNLELPPDLLEKALAHMVVGGKLGSFELKAMSQFFPSVFAAVGNLGVKKMEGVDTATAMLQISKRTAGTDGAAATNFEDFLSGLNAHHTVKRFADHGVDLPGLIANANGRGINPIEAVIQKIGTMIDQPKVVDEALKRAKAKGLDPTKTQAEVRKSVEQAVKAKGLGELFVNQQSKLFLMAMLSNLDEYKSIKAQIRGAGSDVIDQDYKSRMAGPEGKARMAQENIEQVMRRFGEALVGIYEKVGWVSDKLQGLIAALDQISPKIVDTAAQLGALVSALTGVVFALRMLGFGGGAAVAGAAAGGAATAATATVGAATAAGGGSWLGGALGLGAKAGGFLARSGAGLAGALFFASEALQRAFPTTREGMQYRLDAGPIDFATYERARRAEQEWRRDPEAARGRAMMARGRGVTLPDPIARHDLRDVLPEVRIGKPNTSFEAITGSKAPDIPHMIGAAFAGLLKAAGAKPAAPPPPQKVEVETKVTVKVDGPGAVTSQSTTTSGASSADRGPTVGRP